MTQLTIVYWRDIPAQVIAGRGRGGTKVQLDERFEKAIDRAAMRAGMAGTDAYLSEWRKETQDTGQDDPAAAARARAAEIEDTYTPERLRALVENDGWA